MNVYEQKKELFDSYARDVKRAFPGPWKQAADYMKRTGYAEAPASTKFHLCVKGGLLIHSVMVAELALRLSANTPVICSREALLAAALLHDIGKCGFHTTEGPEDAGGTHQPRYVPNPRYRKGIESRWNAPYEYAESDPAFTIRDLSALLVARWGFPWGVVQAVLVHDGAYSPQNADYAGKNSTMAAILMAADTLCAQQFERKDGVVPL